MTTKQFIDQARTIRANQKMIDQLTEKNRSVQKLVRKGYNKTFLEVRRTLKLSLDEVAVKTDRCEANLYYPSVDVIIALLDLLEGRKPVKPKGLKTRKRAK